MKSKQERAERTAELLRAMALRIENHPDELTNVEFNAQDKVYEPVGTVLEVQTHGREIFEFLKQVEDE